MLRFVLRRLVVGIGVLCGAVTVTFFAVVLTAGDQVAAIVGPESASLPGIRAQVAAQYGLDKPLLAQYADRLGALLTGDLGRSYQNGVPVVELLRGQVWPTLQLAASAAATGVLLALLLAVATVRGNRVAERLVSVAEVLAVSVPSFWLGIVLLSVFSFTLRWFPAFGANGPAALVLPTLALALPIGGVLAQVMRQELDRVGASPFALTVRARGLGERALLWRHTLRHALIPVVTLSAWTVGALVGGAVLVEQVFSRPGLGRVLVAAVKHRDTPVVSAIVVLATLVFVLANTLADALYPVLDARLRTEATSCATPA